ncbi:MAG: class I SAM-dependent methyltransferase [Candidatus Zixiibacteriota bacterium]
MPSSHFLQLNEIMQLIFLTRPQSLLDIGVGFGKFGVLAREYLELWDGRVKYGEWTRRIDGIEAFEQYLTPLHDYVYDHVHIGNALDILPTLDIRYDLILLIDVLEHFTYEEGQLLLETCRKKGRNLIVSTPKDIGAQGEAFGNPYETHKFQWQPWHFERFEHYFHIPNPKSYIYFIGEDAYRFTGATVSQ